MEKVFVFTDGGAIGNPGTAAVGVVIKKFKVQGSLAWPPGQARFKVDEGTITKFGKRIGVATNNVAEYRAVIEALEWLNENYQIIKLSNYQIEFFLDSRLVVNQLNGIFKVKEPNLRNLIVKIRQLEQTLGGNISYQSIPREKNFAADLEVKKALFPRNSQGI